MLFTVVWQRLQEVLERERPHQANLQQANFLALRGQIVDRLVHGFCARAHDDDDVLGIRRAVVLEQVVLAADDLRRTCPSRSARWLGRRR